MTEPNESLPLLETDSAERAYQAVLSLIVENPELKGTWLRESSLAQEIGVSRTPVRQALSRLAAEGAIDLIPNRGAQVVVLNEDELDSLYQMRASFEPLAVRLAVPRLTESNLEDLSRLHEEMDRAARDGVRDVRLLGRLNNEFHSIFTQGAGNRHLTKAVRTMIRPALVARSYGLYSEHQLQRSMQHHAELIEAARAGDGEWGEAVMRSHILAARHVFHQDHPPGH